jgi:hypothetical protein
MIKENFNQILDTMNISNVTKALLEINTFVKKMGGDVMLPVNFPASPDPEYSAAEFSLVFDTKILHEYMSQSYRRRS